MLHASLTVTENHMWYNLSIHMWYNQVKWNTYFFLLEVPLKKVGVFSKGHLTMLTVALSTSFIHYCMSSWLGFTIIPKYLLDKEQINKCLDGCMHGWIHGWVCGWIYAIIDKMKGWIRVKGTTLLLLFRDFSIREEWRNVPVLKNIFRLFYWKIGKLV